MNMEYLNSIIESINRQLEQIKSSDRLSIRGSHSRHDSNYMQYVLILYINNRRVFVHTHLYSASKRIEEVEKVCMDRLMVDIVAQGAFEAYRTIINRITK